METIIAYVMSHGKELIELGLAILGAFSILAKLTPTKVDDNILGFIAKIIHTLGLTK